MLSKISLWQDTFHVLLLFSLPSFFFPLIFLGCCFPPSSGGKRSLLFAQLTEKSFVCIFCCRFVKVQSSWVRAAPSQYESCSNFQSSPRRAAWVHLLSSQPTARQTHCLPLSFHESYFATKTSLVLPTRVWIQAVLDFRYINRTVWVGFFSFFLPCENSLCLKIRQLCDSGHDCLTLVWLIRKTLTGVLRFDSFLILKDFSLSQDYEFCLLFCLI